MADGQDKILSMWAYVAVDPTDNTEGIAGFQAPGTPWMPMVGADLAVMTKMRPMAQRIATDTGARITLVHFSQRTEQETLEP